MLITDQNGSHYTAMSRHYIFIDLRVGTSIPTKETWFKGGPEESAARYPAEQSTRISGLL